MGILSVTIQLGKNVANTGKKSSLVPRFEQKLWGKAAGFLTLPIILKKSSSSPSVRGPSASLSAKPFSFRAPLLLTACQATSGNVKESVFKHRLKIHHFSLLYPNPHPDPEPCPLSQSPGFYEPVLLHLIGFCRSVLSVCLFCCWTDCLFTFVKLVECMLLNTL